jgi:hypothetical protein
VVSAQRLAGVVATAVIRAVFPADAVHKVTADRADAAECQEAARSSSGPWRWPRMHDGVRITAMPIFTVSVSVVLGASALYHPGNWTATPPTAALGPRDDLSSHRGHGNPPSFPPPMSPSGLLPDRHMGAHAHRGRGPYDMDERARASGRLDIRQAGLDSRSRATGGYGCTSEPRQER